jgi:hypothetical protein
MQLASTQALSSSPSAKVKSKAFATSSSSSCLLINGDVSSHSSHDVEYDDGLCFEAESVHDMTHASASSRGNSGNDDNNDDENDDINNGNDDDDDSDSYIIRKKTGASPVSMNRKFNHCQILRPRLRRIIDYYLVSEPLWFALQRWYGNSSSSLSFAGSLLSDSVFYGHASYNSKYYGNVLQRSNGSNGITIRRKLINTTNINVNSMIASDNNKNHHNNSISSNVHHSFSQNLLMPRTGVHNQRNIQTNIHSTTLLELYPVRVKVFVRGEMDVNEVEDINDDALKHHGDVVVLEAKQASDTDPACKLLTSSSTSPSVATSTPDSVSVSATKELTPLSVSTTKTTTTATTTSTSTSTRVQCVFDVAFAPSVTLQHVRNRYCYRHEIGFGYQFHHHSHEFSF